MKLILSVISRRLLLPVSEVELSRSEARGGWGGGGRFEVIVYNFAYKSPGNLSEKRRKPSTDGRGKLNLKATPTIWVRYKCIVK